MPTASDDNSQTNFRTSSIFFDFSNVSIPDRQVTVSFFLTFASWTMNQAARNSWTDLWRKYTIFSRFKAESLETWKKPTWISFSNRSPFGNLLKLKWRQSSKRASKASFPILESSSWYSSMLLTVATLSTSLVAIWSKRVWINST